LQAFGLASQALGKTTTTQRPDGLTAFGLASQGQLKTLQPNRQARNINCVKYKELYPAAASRPTTSGSK